MKKSVLQAKPTKTTRKSPHSTVAESGTGRIQMVDVARIAGVSAATVSRALSGNPSIPETTRNRIAEIARNMGYRVNHSAANLRKGQTNVIGVVVLISDTQPISDPFILGLIGHIADALNANGNSMLLTRVSTEPRATLETMVSSGQVSGLLVIGQTYHQVLNELEIAGIPMVVWGAQLPDTRYSVVGSNNLTGGYLATSHLLGGGAKRIVYLGESTFPEGKLRYAGYVKALRQYGFKPDKSLHRHCLLSATEIEESIHQLLVEDVAFDAIFAASDVGAIRAMSALNSHNIKVPAQVKVVGFDNIPMSAHVQPTLTTINQSIDLAATAMVELLNEKLTGSASRCVVLPTVLIERKSSR
jgi:DNA-binding LacI/PurR family transcriptional regulator